MCAGFKIVDIALIIPTHNRPEMLAEAIYSLAQQQTIDLSQVELIVIDDCSTPPVKTATLAKLFTGKLILHRNNTPCGLAYNRDKGVQLASADVVVHLDDDDKLAPNALSTIAQFFTDHPNHESIFLGVKGFGKRKEDFEGVQNQALAKVMTLCRYDTIDNNVISFTDPLLPALLKSVPMCFQRIAVKKSLWIKTNDLRLQAYQKSTSLKQRENSMHTITGPLRDSEWAIYHSLLTSTALLNQPIYLQRCDGQGLVSVAAMRDRQVNAQIAIKHQLVKASEWMTEFQPFAPQVKRNMADTFFNEAYYQFHTLNNRKQALKYWIKSQIVQSKFIYCKFLISLCLPRALLSNK